MRICSIEGCSNKHCARGWCTRHYDAWRWHGDPTVRIKAENGEPLRWLHEHADQPIGPCIIWPFSRLKAGYPGVVWPENRRSKNTGILACRFMCELVNGPSPTAKHEVAHSCGNGMLGCIHPKHLRWDTRQNNVDDRIIHGTNTIGIRHPQAKLNDKKVREIRAMTGDLNSIAEIYGVTPGNIKFVKRRITWKHVK